MEKYEYPAVAKDPDAAPIIKEILALKDQLHMQYLLLGNQVVLIQQKCPHTNTTPTWGDSHWLGKGKLQLSKTCTDCGQVTYKPQGSASEVCERCWGNMEYDGREPGQGGGTHHYHCIVCKAKHSHT